MKNKELISVLMSTYNEKIIHLKEAITSILNQTYNNLEIIIILDNPQNLEIRETVREIKEKDKRVKIIENSKNLGLVASLNKGLKSCKGRYVIRMDADDISINNRIEKQIKYMKENKLDICGSNIMFIDEEGKKIEKEAIIIEDIKKIKKILKYKNCMNHPTFCIDKKRLDKLNIKEYREIKFAEDYDLICRVVASGGIVGNINEKLVKYRVRKDSVSNSNGYLQIVNAKKIKKMFRKNKFDSVNEERVESTIYEKYEKNKEKVIMRKLIMLKDKYLFEELIDNCFVKLIVKGIL